MRERRLRPFGNILLDEMPGIVRRSNLVAGTADGEQTFQGFNLFLSPFETGDINGKHAKQHSSHKSRDSSDDQMTVIEVG